MPSYHTFIVSHFKKNVTQKEIIEHLNQIFDGYQILIDFPPHFGVTLVSRYALVHFEDIGSETEISNCTYQNTDGEKLQVHYITARFVEEPLENEQKNAKSRKMTF